MEISQNKLLFSWQPAEVLRCTATWSPTPANTPVLISPGCLSQLRLLQVLSLRPAELPGPSACVGLYLPACEYFFFFFLMESSSRWDRRVLRSVLRSTNSQNKSLPSDDCAIHYRWLYQRNTLSPNRRVDTRTLKVFSCSLCLGTYVFTVCLLPQTWSLFIFMEGLKIISTS